MKVKFVHEDNFVRLSGVTNAHYEECIGRQNVYGISSPRSSSRPRRSWGVAGLLVRLSVLRPARFMQTIVIAPIIANRLAQPSPIIHNLGAHFGM